MWFMARENRKLDFLDDWRFYLHSDDALQRLGITSAIFGFTVMAYLGYLEWKNQSKM